MTTKVKEDASSIETSVERDKLMRAAKLCASVADSRSGIVPYQSTLVRISSDGCDLSATSGSVSSRSVVGIEPRGKIASFCVNAKRLAEAIAHMPDGAWLKIKSGPSEVSISYGTGKAQVRINTTPAADFPEISPTGPMVMVDRAKLSMLLRSVVFIPLQHEASQDKNSIRLAFDEQLTAWAMNGHMLALATMAAALKPLRTSLHVNAARAFISVLDASKDPFASIALGDVMSVSAADATVSSKATGAAHEAWEQLVPRDPQVSACDRLELLEAVERAGMFDSKEKPNIDLFVDEDGLRTSSAGFAIDGNATSCIDIEGKRKPMRVSLSWRYLRDALGAIDSERVDLSISSEVDPVVIRPAGVIDGQMYLIAPMNRN